MSKHKPATRAEFKAMVLRKLGSPILQINVTDDQVDDCVEEALKWYADYHYDGTEHTYYVHTITSQNLTDKFITVPEEIIGITEIYSLQNQSYLSYAASNMFSGGYEIALDYAFNSSTGGLVSYYLTKTNADLIQQVLVGMTPIRYNRHVDKLYIDFNWAAVSEGDKIVLDCYRTVDPEVSTDVWGDRWLMKFTTAKVKYIWGSNMSKFEGIPLPGGGTMNGQAIKDEARDQLQEIEDELISNYSIPPRDMVG